MGLTVHFEVLNQLGTPMMHSATLANRPAAGIAGRIFFRTDSPFGIFRDTGSAWDQISGASTFSGSLAAGQVAFGSATNTIAGNNNLFWNSANNRLGINTNTPNESLQIVGGFAASTSSSIFNNISSILSFAVTNNGVSTAAAEIQVGNSSRVSFFGRNNGASFSSRGVTNVGSTDAYLMNNFGGDLTIVNQGGAINFASSGSSLQARLFTTGNLVLQNGGTFVDNGNRLQVSGNTTLGGNLTLSNAGGTSFAYATAGTFLHDAVGTNGQLIYTANDNYRIKFAGGGFGTIIGATGFSQTTNNTLLIQNKVNRNANILQFNTSTEFSGGFNIATVALNGNVTLDALANLTGGIHTGIKVDETFAPNNTLKDIRYNGAIIQPTINQTGGAVQITRGLLIQPTLTAAADWRSIEWSNNTGFGLYGAGTAANYLGGSLGIKTTAIYQPSTFSLDVNGGLLIKNTAGTTAQLTLINADPSVGGNNGFLVNTVGGTSGSSYVDLQGYYGTSITGSTALRLNPAGGPVIINSTTNSGEQFQLTGSIRINGQSSATSGGNSGQHLIINLDGTTYKIRLELP
jgi:hypothetical protein